MLKPIIYIAFVASLTTAMSSASASIKTVTMEVPGMTCVLCPITIKKAMMKVDGVQQTITNVDKREAVVTFDDTKTSFEMLAKATANAGYPVTLKGKK